MLTFFLLLLLAKTMRTRMRMTTARWKRSRPSPWRTPSWRRSSRPSAPSESFLLTLGPPSTPSSRRLSRRCGRSSTFPTRTSGGRPSTPSPSSPSPTTKQATRGQRNSLPGMDNYAVFLLIKTVYMKALKAREGNCTNP